MRNGLFIDYPIFSKFWLDLKFVLFSVAQTIRTSCTGMSCRTGLLNRGIIRGNISPNLKAVASISVFISANINGNIREYMRIY